MKNTIAYIQPYLIAFLLVTVIMIFFLLANREALRNCLIVSDGSYSSSAGLEAYGPMIKFNCDK